MEERVIARILLSHSGLTFDKSLINQSSFQNRVNGNNLYSENALSLPNHTQDLTKGYPTATRFESPYTDSLIKLNPNKVNFTSSPFQGEQQNPIAKFSKLSNLALSLNNPYFYNLQGIIHDKTEIGQKALTMSSDDDTDSENVKFLTLLNDLKTLYIGPSFSDRVNESRSKKLNILMEYFSKHNTQNDLKLDGKGCLVYRNLSTNTKFAIYVDYFIKYPNEVRSTSLPLYFRELFLDKILNSQDKFTPVLHFKPHHSMKKKKKKAKKNK